MSYRLTSRAEADLAAIGDHVAADNPTAAARLLEKLEAQCGMLGERPLLGPARPDIAPDARAWVAGKYLILYRAEADGVEIVRVVHGARDLSRIAF
jgi:toxin ParE1/3/4